MVRQRLQQRQFFLMQLMGTMTTNGCVHTDTSISDFYCNIDLNRDIILTYCVKGPSGTNVV